MDGHVHRICSLALQLFALFLAFRCAVAAINNTGLGEGEEGNWGNQHQLTTVVQGYVYCHESCAHNGSRWIKSSAHALVSVMCRNPETHHVTSYQNTRSDAKGFYQMKLLHHNPLQLGIANCKAYLLESNDDTCKVVTNTGNGKLGAYLIMTKVYYNEIFFKAPPFAFTPYNCVH